VSLCVCICALVKHTVDSNFSHECKIQSHHVCADQYAAGECVSVCVCKCMCAHTLSRKRECANGGCHNVCVCVCLSILLCICVVCISLSRFGTLRMPPLSPSLSLSRSCSPLRSQSLGVSLPFNSINIQALELHKGLVLECKQLQNATLQQTCVDVMHVRNLFV